MRGMQRPMLAERFGPSQLRCSSLLGEGRRRFQRAVKAVVDSTLAPGDCRSLGREIHGVPTHQTSEKHRRMSLASRVGRWTARMKSVRAKPSHWLEPDGALCESLAAPIQLSACIGVDVAVKIKRCVCKNCIEACCEMLCGLVVYACTQSTSARHTAKPVVERGSREVS